MLADWKVPQHICAKEEIENPQTGSQTDTQTTSNSQADEEDRQAMAPPEM